jgi:hypothetical protein
MAIAVYNVVLQPEIIVGVGPLVKVLKTDLISVAHKEVRFEFDLYTYHYRITITTDPLSFETRSKGASEAEVDKIRDVWERLRENLAQGYPIETGFPTLKSMPGV